LQRTIGNQAVQRLLCSKLEAREGSLTCASTLFTHDFSQIPEHANERPGIQPKLSVSTPQDIYEQEADRVAEQVMHKPNPLNVEPAGNTIPSVKDLCTDAPLRRARVTAPHRAEIDTQVENQFSFLQYGGRRLSKEYRAFFEPLFGRDFSQVRIHDDSRANALSEEISARAFTHRNHIIFGPGHYSPNTSAGRHLLAHELTHVVQQADANGAPNLQKAEIDPEVRVPARRRVIAGALRRVPFVVASALHVLERIRNGTATERQRQALFEAFLIDASRPESAQQIDRIITTYQRAREILEVPTTLISVIRDPQFRDAWGYAPIGEQQAPYTHEIRVGTAFFRAAPRHPRFAAIMRRCASPPNDMGLLRAITLIHETIHWINGPGHMTTDVPDPTPHGGFGTGGTLGIGTQPNQPFTLGGPSTATDSRRFGIGLEAGTLTLDPSLGLPPMPGSQTPTGGTDILIRNPYRYEMFLLGIRCGSTAAGFSQGLIP
jgi:hypothetical protein